MKKILFFLVLSALPLFAYANLVEFQPNSTIKASEINYNFNFIKDILATKNENINFNTFQSGDLVESSAFESEFEKVRSISIPVPPLTSETITSNELNAAFSQIKNSAADLPNWPIGIDGPLAVDAGETKTIDAGSVKDYSSIFVAQGGTLNITGPNLITVIGSKGPIEINGIVRAYQTVSPGTTTAAPAVTVPTTSLSLTYAPVRVSGGSGGTGAYWTGNSHKGLGYGGSSSNGRGGGGGSGAAGGSGGRPGINGSSSANDTTLSHGGAGGAGGGAGGLGGGGTGGYGPTGYQAGGGGGGFVGSHGLAVYFRSQSSISGIGVINASGTAGYNGGKGGCSSYSSGGGGGGGAGGSGGKIWLHAKVTPSVGTNVSGGGGGAAGAWGGCGPANGHNGAPGSTGQAGSVITDVI